MKHRYALLLLALVVSALGMAQNYFTVVIFSDPHLSQSGHDETSVADMQTYIRNIAGMGRSGGKRIIFPAAPDYVPQADLVMCLGDMDGDSKDDHAEFESVMEGFTQAGIPFITMAGNHDYVPDYWTGTNGDEALTAGNGGIADNEATKATVNKFKSSASNLGVQDMYMFKDGSNHRQPEQFTFTFRGVRFYCGQTYWFQKGYSVEKWMGYVTGRGDLYAPDALLNTLEAFVREHAGEPSVWTQHYPFLAGSDCDRWWLDQNDVGRYIKTADGSAFGTNADLGKWTDDATARDFARKKKDRLADIIRLTKNPVHFSGHTHQWAFNTYAGVRDYTVASTGYSETRGAAYVVLCQEGVGVVQVLRARFDNASPKVEGKQAYLQNVYTGQYLCGGNDWGTQASLGDAPMPLFFEQLPDGTFTIDTGISNGGDNHYLGFNSLYCDQPAVGWTMQETETGSGTWLLTVGGKAFLYGAAKNKAVSKNSSATVTTNPRAHWRQLTRQQLIDGMAEASPTHPVDATFLIACPDFGRNDSRMGSWDGGATQGGANTNMCAEWWNANFDVNQVIAGIPNGVYQLTCQGFYRAGKGGATATDRHAMLYANEVTQPLMAINDGGRRASGNGYTLKAGSVYVPNSMNDASTVFTAGAYADNTLLVNVTDGRLRIGIRKETLIEGDWTIFDRFRLTYLGPKDIYDSMNTVSQLPSHSSDVYDLSGRRLPAGPLQPGVYVIGGRKILVR